MKSIVVRVVDAGDPARADVSITSFAVRDTIEPLARRFGPRPVEVYRQPER